MYKTIYLYPGQCILNKSTANDMHEFGLYDMDGQLVQSGYFSDHDVAKSKAKEEFPGKAYIIRDLTEEWYIGVAKRYLRRIKELQPSFRISQITLDLRQMYYGRRPNDWYTFIPFTYKGVKWCYRETASEDWVHKTYERCEKPKVDEILKSGRNRMEKESLNHKTKIYRNHGRCL